MSGVEETKGLQNMDEDMRPDTEKAMPASQQEEEVVKKKYGGLVPKKPPLISKDHERAYFDSVDWALGKQGVQNPKGPLEALRPKLQPTQQQTRKSQYAPEDGEDKCTVDKASRFSLGSATRKRLADISNLPQRPMVVIQEEKSQCLPTTTKEYIDQLQKENVALMKLLLDRNKIIELSGIELQKLRVSLQKMQQQNLNLAQANSQILAELNSGKDRLKVLQHELGCKKSLLNAKTLELQEKAKPRPCPNTQREVRMLKCEESSSQVERDDYKPCNNTNKKQKSKSLGSSDTEVQAKEKAETKRLCLRRQSARFKSREPESTEHLFEMDVAQFPACSLREDQQVDCLPVKKEENERSTDSRDEYQESQRYSIGRPTRVAAKKIQSYKEIPLNKKMRRNA